MTKDYILLCTGIACIIIIGVLVGFAKDEVELGAFTAEERIHDFENRYFNRYGEYFQILLNQELPSDANANMKAFAQNNLKMNLGTTTPFEVHVYERASGIWDYKIFWHYPPPINIASST